MGSRYILAVVLMLVVMIAWTIIFGNRFAPEQEEIPPTEQTLQDDTPGVDPNEVNSEGSGQPLTFQANPDDPIVNVKTNTYAITFNEKLAIANRWDLVEKKESGNLRFPDRSTDTTDVPLNLIPETALNCLELRLGNKDLQFDLNLRRTEWTADKKSIELNETINEDTLTFTTTVQEQLKISKRFTFYNNSYTVDLDVMFQNLKDDSTPLHIGGIEPANGYELRWGPGINADLLIHEKKAGKPGRRGAEGARAYVGNGKPKRELKNELVYATVLWAGINSNYFSAIMIPDPQLEATYKLDNPKANGEKNVLVTASTETAVLRIPSFQLSNHNILTHTFRLYVGPKDDAMLKEITAPNEPESQLDLSKVIDFGFFGPVAWAMLWLVKQLYSVFQNYGLSIIILTALVKILSFPLTRKAHVSMKKMQQLQPQLVELKEKYRDDPQRLNKATMRIYKENGVNPLSGCIPWLPQLPIFWALFSLLGSAVELRGAPFFFWIDDLSAPDVLIDLPFTIPLIFTQIDAIRFLPILNGLTTWLQQKFVGGMSATPATTNTQAKIMQFMPLIFVFLFYNWASGFVLYWLCNNVFTVAQQYIQTKYFHDGEPDTQDNLPKRKQD